MLLHFLITDIISEIYGKKDAKTCGIILGISTSIAFIILSQWWLQYIHLQKADFAMPAMKTIFSNTPRLMLASMIVYAIVQQFDVWAYHKWWEFTKKKFGNERKYLWIRNNGSTLVFTVLK